MLSQSACLDKKYTILFFKYSLDTILQVLDYLCMSGYFQDCKRNLNVFDVS